MEVPLRRGTGPAVWVYPILGSSCIRCYGGSEVVEMMNIENHPEVLLLEDLQCSVQ